MSIDNFVNAAPMVLFRGIQDNSTVALPIEPAVLPTHLPKGYIFAQKGPTDPQLGIGSTRTQTYGAESFNELGIYHNHQTALLNICNANGNAQMIERVIPDDCGPKSTIQLFLDVLPVTVTQYLRNPDGSIKLDPVLGTPMVNASAAPVAGYKMRWVVKNITTLAGETAFGQLVQGVGTLTDPTSTGPSVLYPIQEWQANSYGQVFNNSGINLWAPTTSSGLDMNIVNDLGMYPMRMSLVSRTSSSNTATITPTLTGDSYVDFVFAPKAVHPIYGNKLDPVSVLGQYQNLATNGTQIQYCDFGAVNCYYNNIIAIQKLVIAAEMLAAPSFTDFDTADDYQLCNIVNGCTTTGAPYVSVVYDYTSANALRLTQNTNIYAAGGADGTMTDEVFAQLVSARVKQYADESSPFMDDAMYPESIIYDSGFPLQTKEDLLSFISVRKDTAVVLSTYVVGAGQMTEVEEQSMAVTLKAFAQNYPESSYFGTPVCRVVIMGRNGTLIDSNVAYNVPLTLELANKASQFMGASNGVWKANYLFDSWPGNKVDIIENINITSTSATTRINDWDAGLNWVQAFDRAQYFFPALHTLYPDDTSVLCSFITVMACVELQKVGARAQRTYSGNISLTDAQLIQRVNTFVETNTTGRFCNLFVIKPQCTITAADAIRGYSWTLPINIYANNEKTAMTLSVVANRMANAPTATA